MSWDQINSACRDGRAPEGIPVHSAEDVMRVRRDWRKYAGI